jgi:hypothetical protein
LLTGVGGAVPFMNNNSNKGVIISRLNVSFSHPLRQRQSCGVFTFNYHTLPMHADTLDVATVFVTSFDAPIYPIVPDLFGQVVGYLTFKPRAGRFSA